MSDGFLLIQRRKREWVISTIKLVLLNIKAVYFHSLFNGIQLPRKDPPKLKLKLKIMSSLLAIVLKLSNKP